MVTHGNEFQSGFPDLFCAHHLYGSRWIEVKNPVKFQFTAAQLRCFPEMHAKGVGIWILGSAEPSELQLLHKPPNWWTYLPVARI